MSLDPIRSELFKRAEAGGFTSAAADIEVIKQIITEQTRIGVRVTGFKHGVVRVVAENSAAAAELYLARAHLLALINTQLTTTPVTKIVILAG